MNQARDRRLHIDSRSTAGAKEFALADTGQMVTGFCDDSRDLAKLLELLLEVGPVRVCKTLMPKHQRMEPAVGFEPTTDGLQNRCSTTELSWLQQDGNTTRCKLSYKQFYSAPQLEQQNPPLYKGITPDSIHFAHN